MDLFLEKLLTAPPQECCLVTAGVEKSRGVTARTCDTQSESNFIIYTWREIERVTACFLCLDICYFPEG